MSRKRLQDNISSAYIASANKLRPAGAPKRIVAYVESYDDVFFWRSILKKFETEKTRFEVMLPSRTSLCRGKKAALMNFLGERLGECMIACVDADYDWLFQGQTQTSQIVCHNPYVLHTYAYAIENLQCYAPNLHTLCVMSTLNDKRIVNLEAFMADFSRIIWPLFVWNVWAYTYDHFREFSMSDMADIIALHNVNPYKLEQVLLALRRRVNRTIALLQRRYPEGRKTYAPLRDKLLSMGLTPETAYLYIQGHTLVENIILPLLCPVCNILRKQREKEITELAEHGTQRQNELASYQHSQAPISEMIRKNTGFRSSQPYQWLTADIQRLIASVEGETPLSQE